MEKYFLVYTSFLVKVKRFTNDFNGCVYKSRQPTFVSRNVNTPKVLFLWLKSYKWKINNSYVVLRFLLTKGLPLEVLKSFIFYT